MVLELALVNVEEGVAFKGFKSPKDSDEIFFSSITHQNKDLVVTADVEACSDVEEFMGCLNIRVVLDDQYAAEALREVEKAAFIAFEKLADDNKALEKRELFYEDLLKIKLKGKKDGWAFTCRDRSFTPLKPTKVHLGVKMEVVFSPGFYYTNTHCGVYLTLKSLVIKTVKR
jgi:hypothetical protein